MANSSKELGILITGDAGKAAAALKATHAGLVDIQGSATKTDAAVKPLAKSIDSLEAQLKELNVQIAKGGDPAALKTLAAEAAKVKKELEALNAAAKTPGLVELESHLRATKEAMLDPAKLKQIRDELTRLDAEIAKGGDPARMKQLGAEVDKVEASMRGLTGATTHAKTGTDNLLMSGAKMAAAFAGAMIATQGLGALKNKIGDCIGAASSLNETMSKNTVVFGEASEQVAIFGSTAAESMGMSKREAVEAAASMGVLFTGMGLTKQQAADMGMQMVRLAGDFSSFNDIPTADALEKIRAGLVGESEPLRSVGVLLNETAVKAKAMAMGLSDGTGELTEAVKVQARYALILEQSTTAQGDFERTSGSLANSQRHLQSAVTNLEAELGKAFLPMVAEVTKALAVDLTNAVKDLQAPLAELPGWFLIARIALGETAKAAGSLGQAIANLNAMIGSLNPAALGAKLSAAISGTNEELAILRGNSAEALGAMRLLSDEMLRQEGIVLNRPPAPYGANDQEQLAKYKQHLADVDIAILNSYMWAQDANEVYNDQAQVSFKAQQAAAKKTADEAIANAKRSATESINEAEKIAEKAKATIWDIGALGKRMMSEVGGAMLRETELWQEFGDRWIEKWGDVDAAIQQTYRTRDAALGGIEEREALNAEIAGRRKVLSERISGERKAFDLRMSDDEFHHREELSKTKALQDYQRILDSGATQAEKNNAWKVYQERLAALVQEHQAFDAEVQWRLSQEAIRIAQETVWTQQQAALEKTLHDEQIARERDAINAKQQADESRINAEWDAWQKAEEAKTVKTADEAKKRATANLEAWRDDFINKLEEESAPGIERFIGMVAGKWADALAGIAGATAAGGGGESGGGGGEDARHQPGGDIFEEWKQNEPEQYEAWRQEHGMQHGGSFVVPGAGGPDSRVVAFPASPGERVTVTPAGRAGGITQILQMQGNYIGFDRSSLEELARQLKPHLDSLVRL